MERETFHEQGQDRRWPIARDPLTGVQIRIGVMGAASGTDQPQIEELCRHLGKVIAQRGCCLLTGACPGLPHQSALGAKEVGGHVIGISPGLNLREHVEKYGSPYREYDVLIFTGFGLMGRELMNIRSSDIVIVAGGRSGTLGEYAIAYEEGKLTEFSPIPEGSPTLYPPLKLVSKPKIPEQK